MPYTKVLDDDPHGSENKSHTLLPVVQGTASGPDGPAAGVLLRPAPSLTSKTTAARVEPPLGEHEPDHIWACFHPVTRGERREMTGYVSRSRRSRNMGTGNAAARSSATSSKSSSSETAVA